MDIKNMLMVGGSVAIMAAANLFVKNKIQESRFKPLEKKLVLKILKKVHKENYSVLKQIAMISSQIMAQYKRFDAEIIKGYLNSPESPIKVDQSFQKNVQKICEELQVSANHFKSSVDFYAKNQDRDILHWIQEGQKHFQISLMGQLPKPKVVVPEFLTKNRLIEIQKKLTLKKYLIQVEVFRKLKGKTQQQLMINPEIAKNIPNPEIQEEKILQEEGLGVNDDPPSAVFAVAIMKFANDPQFKGQIGKIESSYRMVFNKYMPKMQNQKITEVELGELEDQLIYSNAM